MALVVAPVFTQPLLASSLERAAEVHTAVGEASAEARKFSFQVRPQRASRQAARQTVKPQRQEVKKVAPAKRQVKPQKIFGAGRPQSAARPGRGAGRSSIKLPANAGKGNKAARPVKVGGGLRPFKVGKH
ncbi:hypothetical protein EFA69_07575 [Rufibacter immobilis]|uniref:Uncharacterized protein n=1 Tax=Rufibacter immobilis TaxID=1348778 RepID=A0A3M9MX07_9BACT|nr:hypothetical protein EFA69_07575 [Rufibacter immobilis]